MQLRRAKSLGLIVIGGATVIVACSSSTVFETGGFSGSGGVGPVGSTSVGPPVEPPRCPEEQPKAGSSCGAYPSGGCTYGPDTRSYCVRRFDCDGGFWEDNTGDCPVQCPKSFDEIVVGTACGDSAMACSYDEGTCGCFHDGPLPPFDAGSGDAATADASGSGSDGGDAGDGGKKDGGIIRPLVPGVWRCVAPPADPACPSARPRALDHCVKAVTCDYGTCTLGQDLSYDCTGGPSGNWQKSFDQPECP